MLSTRPWIDKSFLEHFRNRKCNTRKMVWDSDLHKPIFVQKTHRHSYRGQCVCTCDIANAFERNACKASWLYQNLFCQAVVETKLVDTLYNNHAPYTLDHSKRALHDVPYLLWQKHASGHLNRCSDDTCPQSSMRYNIGELWQWHHSFESNGAEPQICILCMAANRPDTQYPFPRARVAIFHRKSSYRGPLPSTATSSACSTLPVIRR